MEIIKEYRFKANPKEKEFVEKFIKEFGSILNMSRIVFGTDERGDPKEYLTDRDNKIVLATIQWLGSPVGQGFLKDLTDN